MITPTLFDIQITNERNIKESDILNSRFQKLQTDLQEQMVLSDSIHQENQQKAQELKVTYFQSLSQLITAELGVVIE